jgi:type III secretion system YscQ/HrcQ family protein
VARRDAALVQARRWLSARGGGLGAALEAVARQLSQEQGAALAWRLLGLRQARSLDALDLGAGFAARLWHQEEELLLVLDQRLALVWLDLHFGRLSDVARGLRPFSPMESGLLLARLSATLELLAKRGGPWLGLDAAPARASAVAQRMAQRGGLICVEAEVTCHTTPGRLWLLGSAHHMRRQLEAAPHNPDWRAWCLRRRARLGLRLEWGRLRLPADRLRALAPGWLLTGASLSQHQGTLCLGQHPLWSCHLEGDLTQEHWLRLRPHTQAPEDTMPDQEAPTDPLAHAPVEVVVELARLSLPLARLAGLEAGEVLDLERPLHQPVELRLQGERLATGELVNLDGHLAVRLTQVEG